jgi:hypothetical protein
MKGSLILEYSSLSFSLPIAFSLFLYDVTQFSNTH